MFKKRVILGVGAVVLVLGSFLGFACDDEEDGGNGDTTPPATQPLGDDTPEADTTPE